MFSKKILFPLATVAMASFVACGDDSSSSASNDVAPASVKTFMDIGDIPCSTTQNFCAIVLVEEHNDYYQCNGQWNMMHQGKDSPLAGCESATPAADPANGEGSTTPAEDTGVTTPTETTPAETTPTETTPAETTPAPARLRPQLSLAVRLLARLAKCAPKAPPNWLLDALLKKVKPSWMHARPVVNPAILAKPVSPCTSTKAQKCLVKTTRL